MKEVILWEEGRRARTELTLSLMKNTYTSNTSSDHLPQKDGQKLELILIRVLEISS